MPEIAIVERVRDKLRKFDERVDGAKPESSQEQFCRLTLSLRLLIAHKAGRIAPQTVR
jgi:hypothetical protein